MTVIARRRLAVFCAAASALLLASCAGLRPGAPSPSATAGTAAPVACQVVFDAGSSGTRLFLYAKEGMGWREVAGPKTDALADPVRQIRGKRHADIDAVTRSVVNQLERVRSDGPAKANGQPEWQGFDWPARCRVTNAMVLATAGMRIAEQEDPQRSRELWGKLQQALQARLGPGVRVQARTLTGFEEGLFAWLAVRESRADSRFGTAEMGGASAQVSFPCPQCDPRDDAVRTVTIRGQATPFYSYSFLGLGQDEAPKTLGMAESCRFGVALKQPGWQKTDCSQRIDLTAAAAAPGSLKDPYNFGAGPAAPGQRGTVRHIPTASGAADSWVLTGAFNYLRDDAVSQCCEREGQCFDAPTSCFRAVYLEKYLASLGIPAASTRADVSWTRGAVLCAESQCLADAAPPVCRWSPTGCL